MACTTENQNVSLQLFQPYVIPPDSILFIKQSHITCKILIENQDQEFDKCRRGFASTPDAAESVLHINVTCRDSNLHRSQVYDADITIAKVIYYKYYKIYLGLLWHRKLVSYDLAYFDPKLYIRKQKLDSLLQCKSAFQFGCTETLIFHLFCT